MTINDLTDLERELSLEDAVAEKPLGHNRFYTTLLLGVLALAPLMYLYVYLGPHTSSISTEQAGIGPLAYDFVAPSFAGTDLKLSDFKGQPVVLNFWASWCGPCRVEARSFERTWEAYREQGVLFIGVNMSDGEAGARAFLDEFGIAYPNIRDRTGDISAAYRASGLPTTVFIDREGRIVSRRVGAMREQLLVAQVEELLRLMR